MNLSIKVKPGAKSDSLYKDAAGNIHVRIKAPPVDGKANKYLLKYLASYFELRNSEVALIKGELSQHKTIQFICDENKIINKLIELPNE